MSFQYDISERLSTDHKQVDQVLRRFKNFLTSAAKDAEPNWSDVNVRQLMGDLQFAFRTEIPNHFAIEEEELFPQLVKDGSGAMVNLLLDEHRIIRKLIGQIEPIISKAAADRPICKDDCKKLFEMGDILVSELSRHVEKEECGLVPTIDRIIDRKNAERIFRRYQGM